MIEDFFTLPTAEQLSFDSELYPRAERLDRYRRLYAGGADASADGPVFSANLRAWRLDRGLIYDRRLSGVSHARGPERVARDGFSHYTLTLVLAGRYEADSGSGLRAVPPGSAVLLDMREPMRNRCDGAHIVTTSFARDRVHGAARTTSGLHGRLVAPPQIDLLRDYLESLLRHVERLSQDVLAAATAAMVPLLSIALAPAAASDAVTALASDERVAQVRRLIDRHFADPGFGAEDVVRLSTLSRATIYRLFKPHGGVAVFLQRRRIEAVREALADVNDHRAFATLAMTAGFASESHCSRLFRAVLGVRPGEYRAARLGVQEETDPSRRLLSWQSEVR